MAPGVIRALRRAGLAAAVLPLALLVTWDAGPRPAAPEPPAAAGDWRAPLRPPIVARPEWRARESLRDEPARYTGEARAVFVHHTAHTEDYDCADVPAMLRAMHTDHVRGRGWDDIGYNFLVDKCGTVYEGRAGGADRSVHGAHTRGFNADTVGVAVLGTYDAKQPPDVVLEAVARIAAWKLRPAADPGGRVRLVSTHDMSRFPEGTPAALDVISGHRDTYVTDCPGAALYAALPQIRREAARLRETARRHTRQ